MATERLVSHDDAPIVVSLAVIVLHKNQQDTKKTKDRRAREQFLRRWVQRTDCAHTGARRLILHRLIQSNVQQMRGNASSSVLSCCCSLFSVVSFFLCASSF